jgi:hypothetical protein
VRLERPLIMRDGDVSIVDEAEFDSERLFAPAETG